MNKYLEKYSNFPTQGGGYTFDVGLLLNLNFKSTIILNVSALGPINFTINLY